MYFLECINHHKPFPLVYGAAYLSTMSRKTQNNVIKAFLAAMAMNEIFIKSR